MVVIDADQIQSYIFAAQRLKAIRGASAIQRDLSSTLPLRLLLALGSGNLTSDCNLTTATLETTPGLDWELLYAGGGNVYALFRTPELAADFARQACQLYPAHGGSASASAALVTCGSDFQSTLASAHTELLRRKTSRATPIAHHAIPYAQDCQACSSPNAAILTASHGHAPSALCPACAKCYARSESSQLLDECGLDLTPPKDFEAIASASHPENYLALLYLDIDRLGRFFEELDHLTPAIFRDWSLRIQGAMHASVLEGCRAAASGLEPQSVAPFEVLLLGGDDAIIAISAHRIFAFLDAFRQSFGPAVNNQLSYSAGLVWAHHHVPITQLLHLARQLLRSAKATAPDRIDYSIFSNALAADLRDREYLRSGRPYAIGEFLQLASTITNWKSADFPSSKVAELYPLAFDAPDSGQRTFISWQSRLGADHRRLALDFFPTGLRSAAPTQHTRAADLAELWSFVR